MEIALHEIEPWLIKYQFARYNLAESGMVNQTLGDLLQQVGMRAEDLNAVFLGNADTRGSLALRQAVADLYPGTDPASVLITTGTSEALFLYFHVRHRRGANVVVPLPAFQSLPELPHYLGYELRPLQLRVDQDFRPDLQELERLVDENTQAIVLNTPHNPTGILFTDEEIARVTALAEKVGADVLADEHYRFVPFGEEELIPTIYRPGGQVVAVGSMIKCFGCVGLRVGWILGPPALLDACRNLKDYTTHTVCGINDELATWLLRSWRKIMPRYREWVRSNVDEFAAFVGRHADHLEWVPAQGGMVAFPRLKDRSLSSAQYSLDLVEQTEVFLLPGETFGRPGHFRIGFGLESTDFTAALKAWEGFIQRRGWIAEGRTERKQPQSVS